MQTRQKFSIGYFVAAIVIMLIIQSFLAPRAQQLSYSTFKQLLPSD